VQNESNSVTAVQSLNIAFSVIEIANKSLQPGVCAIFMGVAHKYTCKFCMKHFLKIYNSTEL
jgi:hypothetical protein